MSIIDELGSYNQEITNKENKKKLLRTLTEPFKSISMVCNVTHISFKDVVYAIK